MRTKRVGIAAFVGALALTVAACGSSDSASEETATEEVVATEGGSTYVAIISKGFQHQFWQAVQKGAEDTAGSLGVDFTYEGPENESQVDKQMEQLEAALAKNPSALCFAALDSKAAIPLLEKAKAAGIPVIAFDSGVDSDIPITTAATDSVASAALAADKMVELIGGKGKVAIVAHDQTSRTGIDRVAGFKDQIESKYPDVTIVDIQYGGGDQLKSTDITKAIIAAHPDIKGIFGANEGSAIGVLNGVKESGNVGKITIIGYDSGKAQKDAIKAGEMAGAITQDPIGIGTKCIEAAVAATKGESVAPFIDTGFKWYDKTNIDNPDIAAVLYD
ncbi:MAG: substrate-binding domain-containing protein [Actinobacteria bacterium]|nr:substrate-binding domain-containing protein [Actinomycetota bacterium]